MFYGWDHTVCTRLGCLLSFKVTLVRFIYLVYSCSFWPFDLNYYLLNFYVTGKRKQEVHGYHLIAWHSASNWGKPLLARNKKKENFLEHTAWVSISSGSLARVWDVLVILSILSSDVLTWRLNNSHFKLRLMLSQALCVRPCITNVKVRFQVLSAT